MLPFRKFLVGSLLFHVAIILILTIIGLYNQSLKKTFIVFGAHSRKHSVVNYKALHNHVPFVGKGGKRNSKGKQKSTKKHTKQSQKKKNKRQAKKQPKKEISGKSKFHELNDEKSNKKQALNLQRREKEKLAAQQKEEQEAREQKEREDEKKRQEEEARKQEEKRKQQEKDLLQKEQEKQKAQEEEHLNQEDEDISEGQEQSAQENDDSTNDTDSSDTEEEATGFSLVGEYDTKDLRMYHKHVQQEIDQHWRPPVGVPKGTISIGLFKIGSNGTVEKFELIKRSNILIYDLSIIRDARKCQFDKCLWDKQFKVEFRQ
jgi:colicin import membrane protein